MKVASQRRLLKAFYEGDGSLDKVRLVEEHMRRMLAVLRAQYWVYQTAHWQVAGTGFYGDHLLFSRLYETVQGEVDTIAEKIVGYVGRDGVDAMQSLATTAHFIAYWSREHDAYKRSLMAEEMLQSVFRASYDALKEADALTLGLDDWIMATANTHESHTYLLQQRIADELRGVTAAVESGAAAPSAEHHFFDNPEKREVRELADTKAVSNDPAVAETAKQEEDGSRKEVKQEVQKARKAPPTPSEILDQPGGKDFSTLNRFVVTTEEPVKGVPESHDEVDKHPPEITKAANKLASRWLTTTGKP